MRWIPRLFDRLDRWLHTGDPTPSDIGFALLCVAVFLFIAEFGLR